MITELKKQEIIEKMYKLSIKARQKFGEFLANHFSDDDLRDLTMENADKLLKFISKI